MGFIDSEASKAENCNIYINFRRNESGGLLGVSGFEGIPQNLLINIGCWIVLNLLFVFLRKNAWDYGRMALADKDDARVEESSYETKRRRRGTLVLIAQGSDSDLEGDENGSPQLQHDESLMASLKRGFKKPPNLASSDVLSNETGSVPLVKNSTNNNSNSDGQTSPVPQDRLGVVTTRSEGNLSEIEDIGYFAWIRIVTNLRMNQYLDRCGPDTVHYLTFQKHLIFLAGIITVCCIFIILPINMHKSFNLKANERFMFSDTTIINVENHNLLWIHVLLAIGFLFISIVVMRHYSKALQITAQDSSDVSRTVVIVGLNKRNCREEMLREHLKETYPESEVTEVSFGYNIKKLQSLEYQRLLACSAKNNFESKLQARLMRARNNEKVYRSEIRPYCCGVMGCCCERFGCCAKEDAIDYYEVEELKYSELVEEERERTIRKPVGIAFVTFSTVEAAEKLMEDYACSSRLFMRLPKSTYTRDLMSNRWIVRYAPRPDDINWENLTLDYKMWYIKFFVLNTVLAFVVVVFTTPVYLFSIFAGDRRKTNFSRYVENELSFDATHTGLLVDTLPTVILWILGVTLISLVYQSDRFIGFWTKTAGSLSEMIKIFFFLTAMVVILPSLGVTSLSYFLNKGGSVSWSCIFYKENGAFFVNYICTSCLAGTAAELMRLPELFMYSIKLCCARSAAELSSIKKAQLWNFPIGSHYAWTMLHFAIFTCFSVIYPLVTPFGLLYLLLKHFVDRYNIYFAYAPCKVEKSVHATAVNFVIICMFFLQANLLAYIHFYIGINQIQDAASHPVRSSEIRALQVFSLLGFAATAALFLGQLCFNVCADFGPIHQYKGVEDAIKNKLPSPEEVEDCIDVMEQYYLEQELGKGWKATYRKRLLARRNDEESEESMQMQEAVGEASEKKEPGHARYVPTLLRPEFLIMLTNIRRRLLEKSISRRIMLAERERLARLDNRQEVDENEQTIT